MVFKFRLYVAGDAPSSALAMANLAALCRTYLPEYHDIEVVDVFQQGQRALTDGILMTPTLVKLQPRPTCTIVGTLSDTQPLLLAMGLGTVAA
ncbi:MAG TPA: circadian clock KaiB family protein [Thermoanaerobaculia bacterium]|nr:circadian clock KaiB family protein [Thermoanaerobaculia bacterium]